MVLPPEWVDQLVDPLADLPEPPDDLDVGVPAAHEHDLRRLAGSRSRV